AAGVVVFGFRAFRGVFGEIGPLPFPGVFGPPFPSPFSPRSGAFFGGGGEAGVGRRAGRLGGGAGGGGGGGGCGPAGVGRWPAPARWGDRHSGGRPVPGLPSVLLFQVLCQGGVGVGPGAEVAHPPPGSSWPSTPRRGGRAGSRDRACSAWSAR